MFLDTKSHFYLSLLKFVCKHVCSLLLITKTFKQIWMTLGMETDILTNTKTPWFPRDL